MSFQLILAQYPKLDPTRFQNAAVYIIPVGLALAVTAIVQERYPKGDRTRLFLDGIYVTLSLLWLLSLFGGSPIISSNYEGHHFSVDVTPIAILAILVAMMNFLHDLLEYRYYGKKAKTGTTEASDKPAELPLVLSCGGINAEFIGGVSLTSASPLAVAGATPPVAGLSFHVEGTAPGIETPSPVFGDEGGPAFSFSLIIEPRSEMSHPATLSEKPDAPKAPAP